MLAAKVATNRGVPSLGVIVRRGVREYRSISSLAATRSTHSSIAASPQSYVPKIGFSSAHSAWRQSLTSQPMSTLSRPIPTETEVTNLVDNNKVRDARNRLWRFVVFFLFFVDDVKHSSSRVVG